jgi:hypothetical protein
MPSMALTEGACATEGSTIQPWTVARESSTLARQPPLQVFLAHPKTGPRDPKKVDRGSLGLREII